MLAVNGIADVDFIFENTLDLRDRPCVAFFFGCFCIDVSEFSVSRVVEPACRGYLFINENVCDLGCSRASVSKVKYLFDDLPGFLVDLQKILYFAVLLVADGRIRTYMLSCGKLGVERGFDFTAGVFCKPFIE